MPAVTKTAPKRSEKPRRACQCESDTLAEVMGPGRGVEVAAAAAPPVTAAGASVRGAREGGDIRTADGRPADDRRVLMAVSVSAAMTWLACAVLCTGISALTTIPLASSERRRAASVIERTTLSAASAAVMPEAATTASRNLR